MQYLSAANLSRVLKAETETTDFDTQQETPANLSHVLKAETEPGL